MFQADWLSVCVTQQPFEYSDLKDIIRGRGTSIIMKLNESKKGKNTKKQNKNKTLSGVELTAFWL